MITWPAALAYCDGLDWGGYDDWRLPDEFELQSIVSVIDSTLQIDSAVFPETPASSSSRYHWTSSSYSGEEDRAWVVSFYITGSGVTYTNSSDYDSYRRYLRCVRGDPAPRPSNVFTRDTSASNEPLVQDAATGLMWQGCPSGLTGTSCEVGETLSYTWQEALTYCEGLTWAGHDNWRLPSVVELRSIVDTRMYTPAIDTMAFPATLWEGFWTSSSRSAVAYSVSFDSGAAVESNKTTSALHVRCVL
jgi:hypothetical protein